MQQAEVIRPSSLLKNLVFPAFGGEFQVLAAL